MPLSQVFEVLFEFALKHVQEDILSVVNFKCDPILIGLLLDKEGYFPAYHMNKTSQLTVALDGSVPDDEVKLLLDMSFEATAPKMRKKKKEEYRRKRGEVFGDI